MFLGRLLPDFFPKIFGPSENEPLGLSETTVAFEKLAMSINSWLSKQSLQTLSHDEIAYGFIKVANESMCRPIRSITEAKGFDPSTHQLACFGGFIFFIFFNFEFNYFL